MCSGQGQAAECLTGPHDCPYLSVFASGMSERIGPRHDSAPAGGGVTRANNGSLSMSGETEAAHGCRDAIGQRTTRALRRTCLG